MAAAAVNSYSSNPDLSESSSDEGSGVESDGSDTEDKKNLIHESKDEKDEVKISEDCIYLLSGDARKKQVCRRFLVYPRDADNCICSICFSLFDNPVILDNSSSMSEEGRDQCGHVFCKNCITRAHKANPNKFTCPRCRQDSRKFRLVPNKELMRTIASLDFKCPYENKGCTWRGQFGFKGQEYKTHIDSCIHRGQECKDCKTIVEWGDEDKHISTCPEADVTCPNSYVEVKCESISDSKKMEKPELNKCGLILKRKELKMHEFECKYRIVSCSMVDVGCEWKGAFIDLSSHIDDASDTHVALMRVYIVEEKKKTKDIEKKLDKAKRETVSLKRMADEAILKERKANVAEFGRGMIEVEWKEELNDYSPFIKLNADEYKFGIRNRSISLRTKNFDSQNSEIYMAIIDKEGQIIESWEWSKVDRVLGYGFHNVLTPDLISKALTSTNTIRFMIIVDSHNNVNNPWNTSVIKKKKMRSNLQFV